MRDPGSWKDRSKRFGARAEVQGFKFGVRVYVGFGVGTRRKIENSSQRLRVEDVCWKNLQSCAIRLSKISSITTDDIVQEHRLGHARHNRGAVLEDTLGLLNSLAGLTN